MHSENRRLLCAGVLVATVCVVGVGLAYRGGPLGPDQSVMTWIGAQRYNTVLPAVSTFSSLFGPAAVIAWTVLIAVGLIVRDHTIGRAVAVMAGVAAAGVVTEIVKLIVARPRPPMQYHSGISEMTYSYPSGHVTGTTALAATTAVVVTGGLARTIRRWAIGVAAMISVVAAATRLYLGVHWFTDVLAAFAVAVAAALVIPAAANAVLSEIRHRYDRQLPDWFAPYPPHQQEDSVAHAD